MTTARTSSPRAAQRRSGGTTGGSPRRESAPCDASQEPMPTTRGASVVIDARTLPAQNRSSRIFDAFDKLPVGGILELNEETDPRSLRDEFQQYRPGRFSRDARNHGSTRWTIRLERIDERADTATFLSHCAPFANAKQTTINELAAVATERSYKTGDTIFDEGEMWPYLGFVRSGKV